MVDQVDVVVGLGEIGSVFAGILKEADVTVIGVDLDQSKCYGEYAASMGRVDVLHICVPYCDRDQFQDAVLMNVRKYHPYEIIIHSSVRPETTENLVLPLNSYNVAYSPFRGVHARMREDMKRYTKYYSCLGRVDRFIEEMKRCGICLKEWLGLPRSLELAKLLMDVVYYGWLIVFAQHVRVQADKYHVDHEQLWEFTDEIHKYLGNRPRMFSGSGIGGHCVLQDKNILNDAFLDAVFSHDQFYRRTYKVKPDG